MTQKEPDLTADSCQNNEQIEANNPTPTVSTQVSPTQTADSALNAPELQNSEKNLPPNPSQEYGGRKGPEPTRYGDWEKNGRCIDF